MACKIDNDNNSAYDTSLICNSYWGKHEAVYKELFWILHSPHKVK